MEDILINDEILKDVIPSAPVPTGSAAEGKDLYKEDIEMEGEKDESKQDNKSDDVILSSNVILRSINNQNVDLSYFDSTVLWTNPNPLSALNTGEITLEESYLDYDLIMFKFYVNVQNRLNEGVVIVPRGDLVDSYDSANPVVTLNNYYNNGNYPRVIQSIQGSNIKLKQTPYGLNTNGVPTQIIGLKYKTQTTPEPTPTPNPNPNVTTSGNVINNYYNNYFGVSENVLSWNLLNKPINQYTVSESLFLYQFLILFFVMMYLLIRRVVFKWK